MDKTEKLKPRQLAVIDSLFKGELDEQAILNKYKVSHNLYQKWLTNKNFADELDRRIESSFRQSSLLIARYAPLAAAKLVQLTDCDKEETARKACLDIISLLDARYSIPDARERGDGRKTRNDGRVELNDDAASRLLAALAEENTEKET